MNLIDLDSRVGSGTDRSGARRGPSSWSHLTTARPFAVVQPRAIRVIVGHLGDFVRLSAPELDIVVDGSNLTEAWQGFVKSVTRRPDRQWLTFDVGSTRVGEISEGLDAPEDEVWQDRPGYGE